MGSSDIKGRALGWFEMTGIARFVDAGLTDAEQRIASRLPPPVIDDPWVARVVESGVLARALTWSIRSGRSAVATSRAVAIVRVTTTSWRHAPWAARRRTAGLCLLVAVITHVVLVGALNRPVGWLWLILPGIAAMVGFVLVAASVPPSGRSR